MVTVINGKGQQRDWEHKQERQLSEKGTGTGTFWNEMVKIENSQQLKCYKNGKGQQQKRDGQDRNWNGNVQERNRKGN